MMESMEKGKVYEGENPPHANGTRYQTIYGGTIDNFGKHLIGRNLSLELSNNKTITGKLKSYGQFDVVITDSRTGQDVIVFKHAIVTATGDLSPRRDGK
ncbi:MAG: hypothetical protein ACP5G5_04540 [Thermoplasmata archaeon]|jgi:sRNA-binding regulator protein Hfq